MKFKPLPLVISALAFTQVANAQDVTVQNATVTEDATVNGTLRVQPQPSPVTVTPNNDATGQMNPVAGTDDGTSTAVRTVLGGTVATYTTATGGGAEISNNGDVRLNSSTGQNNAVTVRRVTEVRVFNADQGANAGQPVAGTQSYYLVDELGNEIPGTRVSQVLDDPGTPEDETFTAAQAQAAFEESLDGDGVNDYDFTSADFDAARVSEDLANTGGNLTVGGQTSTNGIDNNNQRITGVADGVDSSDAINRGQLDTASDELQAGIDAEAEVRAAEDEDIRTEFRAADDELQAGIDAEAEVRAAEDEDIRTEFRSADDELQAGIDAEAFARSSADANIRNEFRFEDTAIRAEFRAADSSLQASINSEASTRSSEDADIRNEFRSADSAILTEFRSADTSIRNEFRAADTSIRNEYRAADNAIRNEFQSADRSLKNDIEQNTRGIAMVAAMTNTRVEAGKTHGLDFNVAQFQSATGFSFGYANRINDNVQIHTAAATSNDFEEAVGRIGVSFQW